MPELIFLPAQEHPELLALPVFAALPIDAIDEAALDSDFATTRADVNSIEGLASTSS